MHKKAFIILIIISSFIVKPLNIAKAEDPINLGITEYKTKVNSTYARGDSWSVKYENEVYKWSSEPIWVWDGSNYISYIFDNQYNTKGYYQVQSGLIAARIYDYYAEFYTPDMLELRLYDERWEVQQWTGKKWSNIGAQSGTPTFSISANSNNINITKTFTSWAGILEIQYIFREGQKMKHKITFKSELSEVNTFAVRQEWAGIIGNSVNDHNIISKTILNETYFKFKKANQTLSIIEDQNDAIDKIQNTTIDIHTNGLKASFFFSNWTLSKGEKLEIDPSTATLNDPIEDGYIDYDQEETDYTRKETSDTISIREPSSTTFGKHRGYVEWDISSIQDDADVIKTVFKYHGNTNGNPDDNAIHHMANRPSTSSDSIVFIDCGDGAVYTNIMPTVGSGQQANLGASANADLETRLTDDWFAIGMINTGTGYYTDTIYAEEYGSANPTPTLYVEYSIQGPYPPTLNSPVDSSRFNMGTMGINFTWTFSDPTEGDNQTAYRIQLDNDSNFGSPEVDSGKVISGNWWSTQDLPNNVEKYYWRVKNWDESDLEGDWSDSNYIISDRWKLTDFWASKNNPIINETVYLYAKGNLEYDGHQPDSDDNITIEEVDFNWDWVEERFYAPVTKESSGSIIYNDLTSIYEHTYNITEGTMNGKSVTVIWGSSQYNFYGIYWENGTKKGAVNVTAYFNEGSEKFEVNGSKTKQFDTQPIMFTYPLSGGGTRCIYTSSANETYYLFEPNIEYASYSFTIKDYSGKIGQQDSYLESLINVNTTERLVERKLIWDTENPTTLVLMDNFVYIIQITTEDDYVYRFDYFIPGVSLVQTLTIRDIDFTEQAHYVGEDISVEALRPIPTHIRINYKDDLELTEQVFVEICYLNGTQVWSDTSTNQIIQFNWYDAVNTTDYLVKLSSSHPYYGTIRYSKFLEGSKGGLEEPPDFEVFGKGFKYGIGVFLLFAAFSLFSKNSMLFGTFATISVAYLLRYAQFLPIPYIVLHASMALTILWGVSGGGR